MNFYKEIIEIDSPGKKINYIDITQKINDVIRNSNFENGLCYIISPHTTCSVFFEEFSHDKTDQGDEFLQLDLNNVLSKIIPDHVSKETYIYPGQEHYHAVESWPNASEYLPNGDRAALWNGDAHLKATIVGSSVVVDFENSLLALGSTGYIYFADFDTTRSRTRRCKIVLIGK